MRTLSMSPIATAVGLDTPAQYNGVMVKAIVAGDASFLNDGSGVAQLGPKVSFEVRRNITIRTFVNVAGMAEDEALNWVKSVTVINAVVLRKEFALVVDGGERCMHTHPSIVTVDEAKAKFTFDLKSEQVKIEIPARETHVSRTAKLVKNSVKALARTNADMLVFDENGDVRDDWELVLPPEAIKGLWEIYLEMACHWKQVSIKRDPANPQPQELKDLVQEFLKAKSKKASFLYQMEQGEFERCYSTNKDDSRYSFHAEGVVRWTGLVVEGYINLAMENTPVFLSMGKSLTTPEMLLTQSLICPELVEHRVNAKAYKAKAWRLQQFLTALNTKTPPSGAKVLDVEGEVTLDLKLSDRSLFARLCKAFPEGLVLTHEGKTLYLDLVACKAIGPVDADGNGYSYVKEICSFFRFLATKSTYVGDTERRIESFFNLCAKHLSGAVADAPRFLAKVLRPTKVQVTKVTTSSGASIKPWEMHVSSEDPRVLDGVWEDGAAVINSRCPVFFGAVYKTVINDNVPVGLVMVNPLCWHANNKGDADGDTCFTERIPEELEDVVRKAYDNAGYLGKDAYFRLAGLKPQV